MYFKLGKNAAIHNIVTFIERMQFEGKYNKKYDSL